MPAGGEELVASYSIEVDSVYSNYSFAKEWRTARALGRLDATMLKSGSDLVAIEKEIKKTWKTELVEGDAYAFHHVFIALASVGLSDERARADFFALLRKDIDLNKIVLERLPAFSASGSSPASPTTPTSREKKSVQCVLPRKLSWVDIGVMKDRIGSSVAQGIEILDQALKNEDFIFELFYNCWRTPFLLSVDSLKSWVLKDARIADIVLRYPNLRSKLRFNPDEIHTLISNIGKVVRVADAERYFEHLFCQFSADASLSGITNSLLQAAAANQSTPAVQQIRKYFYGEKGVTRSADCRFGLMSHLVVKPAHFVTLAGAGAPPAHLMDLFDLTSPSTINDFVKSLGRDTQAGKLIADNIGSIVVHLENRGFSRKNLNVLLNTKVVVGGQRKKLIGEMRRGFGLEKGAAGEVEQLNSEVLWMQFKNNYVRGRLNLNIYRCLGVVPAIAYSSVSPRRKELSLVMLADTNLWRKLKKYQGADLYRPSFIDEKRKIEENFDAIRRGDLSAIKNENGTINEDCALVIASDPRLWTKIMSRRRGLFRFSESKEQYTARKQALAVSAVFRARAGYDSSGKEKLSTAAIVERLIIDLTTTQTAKTPGKPAAGTSPAAGVGTPARTPGKPPAMEVPPAGVRTPARTPGQPAADPSLSEMGMSFGGITRQLSTEKQRQREVSLAISVEDSARRSRDLQASVFDYDLKQLSSDTFQEIAGRHVEDIVFWKAVVSDVSKFKMIAGTLPASATKFSEVVFAGKPESFKDAVFGAGCHPQVHEALSSSEMRHIVEMQESEKLVLSRTRDLNTLNAVNFEDVAKRHAKDLPFWEALVADPEKFKQVAGRVGGESAIAASASRFAQLVFKGMPQEAKLENFKFVASIFDHCHKDVLRALVKNFNAVNIPFCQDFWIYAVQNEQNLCSKLKGDGFVQAVFIEQSFGYIKNILGKCTAELRERIIDIAVNLSATREKCTSYQDIIKVVEELDTERENCASKADVA